MKAKEDHRIHGCERSADRLFLVLQDDVSKTVIAFCACPLVFLASLCENQPRPRDVGGRDTTERYWENVDNNQPDRGCKEVRP